MRNVGSALSNPAEDEDDLFVTELVKPRPFGAEPLDIDTLPVDRAERLQAIESVLMASEKARSLSVARSQMRFVIETGVALRILVEEDLYLEAGFANLDDYAQARLHRARPYVYELIHDADRLLRISPLSEISDKPFNPSQAKVLAPLMEPTSDEPGAVTRAALVVADVENSGRKRTAAALKAAAEARGFLVVPDPVVPAPARGDGIVDAEIVETDGTRATAALHALLQQQKTVYDGIGGGLLGAALEGDPAGAESVLGEFLSYLSRTEHRIRTARKPTAPDES